MSAASDPYIVEYKQSVIPVSEENEYALCYTS